MCCVCACYQGWVGPERAGYNPSFLTRVIRNWSPLKGAHSKQGREGGVHTHHAHKQPGLLALHTVWPYCPASAAGVESHQEQKWGTKGVGGSRCGWCSVHFGNLVLLGDFSTVMGNPISKKKAKANFITNHHPSKVKAFWNIGHVDKLKPGRNKLESVCFGAYYWLLIFRYQR